MTTSLPVPMRPARVSRQRIVGFKTFAGAVVLDILPDPSGLVGPDGWGKSDVMDALRWAMGGATRRSFGGS